MERSQLYEASVKHFFDPVSGLLSDPSVTEIMINGPREIYYESQGAVHRYPRHFRDEDSLMSAIRNVAEYVGRPVGPQAPTLDARLPNGSRVHVILPPASQTGPTVTIRKFREAAFTLQELERIGSIDGAGRAVLASVIENRRNTIVSGATGSGKTSILNALSREIPDQERIVVIEDSRELKLHQPHQVCLECTSDLTLRDLFVNALRMRPDRIVIGEVRRGEALELVHAMLTGHDGSLSTIHASSPQVAATRLETLCLQSDVQMPIYVARQQIVNALDVVIQTKRTRSGQRKITEISELSGLDSNQQYVWNSLYCWDSQETSRKVRPRMSLPAEGGNIKA